MFGAEDVTHLRAYALDRDDGLEAAAAAAPAQRAVRVDDGVADLAGQPAGAAVQLTGEDQPGAEAVRRLDVDEVARTRRPAPARCSPSAPRCASFSTWTSCGSIASRVGDRRRRCRDPPSSARWCSSATVRRNPPDPAARPPRSGRRAARGAALRSALRARAAAVASAVAESWSTSASRRSRTSCAPDRSATGDRHVRVSEVEAEHDPVGHDRREHHAGPAAARRAPGRRSSVTLAGGDRARRPAVGRRRSTCRSAGPPPAASSGRARAGSAAAAAPRCRGDRSTDPRKACAHGSAYFGRHRRYDLRVHAAAGFRANVLTQCRPECQVHPILIPCPDVRCPAAQLRWRHTMSIPVPALTYEKACGRAGGWPPLRSSGVGRQHRDVVGRGRQVHAARAAPRRW